MADIMKKSALPCLLALAGLNFGFVQPAVAEDNPNRINASLGAATHSGDVSAFLSADYTYKFSNNIAAAIFYERAGGDFDIEAVGITVGYIFENGFKFGVGPGLEHKLRDGKTLDLWHVTAGYDWPINNWTVGPTASYDFIESNNNVLYVGLAVGFGF
jgi:hypothetical protein